MFFWFFYQVDTWKTSLYFVIKSFQIPSFLNKSSTPRTTAYSSMDGFAPFAYQAPTTTTKKPFDCKCYVCYACAYVTLTVKIIISAAYKWTISVLLAHHPVRPKAYTCLLAFWRLVPNYFVLQVVIPSDLWMLARVNLAVKIILMKIGRWFQILWHHPVRPNVNTFLFAFWRLVAYYSVPLVLGMPSDLWVTE